MPNLEVLQKLREEVQSYDAQLVAVSKTKPISDIQEVFEAGQLVFGENRVQELREKQPALSKSIQWHAIGHLQSNKVKYIAPYITLIHGVESVGLLQEIDKRAAQNERTIDILLQMHIAQESSKFGLDENELNSMITYSKEMKLQNIRIRGLMGMATFTDDKKLVRKEFRELRKVFETTKEKHFPDDAYFSEISMGMSGDYKIALEEGSTIVRVGSLIFGHR